MVFSAKLVFSCFSMLCACACVCVVVCACVCVCACECVRVCVLANIFYTCKFDGMDYDIEVSESK